MRHYEAMIIFDPAVEPQAIQAVLERALKAVTDTGGTPGVIDRWGRRPFAYEVRHRREGYYVVMELAGGQPSVDELDRLLRLADEVLRHKVVRLPDKVVAARAAGGGGEHGPEEPIGSSAGSRPAAEAV